jgi:hypothetical protein
MTGCAVLPRAAQQSEVVWQGAVRVTGRQEIPAGTTLVIRPGTRVVFGWWDENGDGKGDAALVVRGGIRAEGTPGAPVVFEAEAGAPLPGWGEIRVEDGTRAEFVRCRFSGAQWAVHVHRTPLRVAACTFERNEWGVKFTGGPVEIRESLFRGNGTAVRYWESDPLVEGNRFDGNGTAIFCREGSRGTVLRGNNFAGSADYHVKLGELQAGDVEAAGNWWGTDREARIEELLFDREDESYLGRVLFRPFATQPLALAGAAAGEGKADGR